MHTHPTNYLPFSSQHRLFYAFTKLLILKREWIIEKIPMSTASVSG